MGLLPGAPGLLVFLSGLLCHSSLVEPHLVPRCQPRVVAQCVTLEIKKIKTLGGRPARQPSPHSDSGSSHWRSCQGGTVAAAATGGASPRQHGPARGGAAAAAAAAGRVSPRSRSPRSRSPPAARQNPPARPAAGQPSGRQDSPSGSTAGSRPASPTAQTAAKRLRANPFAPLTDQEDMDASPGTLLAPQLPADPTAPDAATA